MFFETIFAAAALWSIIRLAALARVCLQDRNRAGAAMLITMSIIIAAFAAMML